MAGLIHKVFLNIVENPVFFCFKKVENAWKNKILRFCKCGKCVEKAAVILFFHMAVGKICFKNIYYSDIEKGRFLWYYKHNTSRHV